MGNEPAMFCCQDSNPLLTLFKSSQHSTKHDTATKKFATLNLSCRNWNVCDREGDHQSTKNSSRSHDDAEGSLCSIQTITE